MSTIPNWFNDELTKQYDTIIDSIKDHDYTPTNHLILRSLNVDLNTIKLVLVGSSSPYNHHDGLAFSGSKQVVCNIYDALMRDKLIDAIPATYDLRGWSSQGIVLLNTSLTTPKVDSGGHICQWKPFVVAILQLISQVQNPIFVFFGATAQSFERYIGKSTVYKWTHPNVKSSFSKCDIFGKINIELLKRDMIIRWGDMASTKDIANTTANVHTVNDTNMVDTQLLSKLNKPFEIGINNIYMSTDGGARKNGKVGCECSWAYYIKLNSDYIYEYGIEDKNASNNVGELTAIGKGIQRLITYLEINKQPNKINIVIYSDSEYSIKCITLWYPSWISNNKTKDKKNLDLLRQIYSDWLKLSTLCSVKFEHVRSHKVNDGTMKWHLNDVADSLATHALIGI